VHDSIATNVRRMHGVTQAGTLRSVRARVSYRDRCVRAIRCMLARCAGILIGTSIAALATGPVDVAAQVRTAAIDTITIRNDSRILAADSLAGRGTGSEGAQIAAEYIVRRLREIGLRPALDSGFFQAFPVRRTVIGDASRIVLVAAADTASFATGREFVHGHGSGRAFGDFDGPAVFVGTAQSAVRVLSGHVVSGNVIVIAGTLPENADTLLRSLEQGGAAAIVQLIADPDYVEQLSDDTGDTYDWVDGDVDEPRWQPRLPVIAAGPRMSRALLALADVPESALEGTLDAPIPLAWHISTRMRTNEQQLAPRNVIGVIPGSDPALRDDVVLYTAHYDHLGIESNGTADSIYNGFSDNAAGVAMLLSIAKEFADRPAPRTVAFAFLTGEERGLLGSSWLAAHSPWPLQHIAAVINLDGGAPPVPPVAWRLAGQPGTAISALAADIVKAHGWQPVVTGTRANSDHWPLMAHGVPAIFIIPGNDWENTSTERRDALRKEFDHYHQPNDEWRPDFPFAGLQRYALIALEIGRRIAEQGVARGTRNPMPPR
jgi:Peptidase family M28